MTQLSTALGRYEDSLSLAHTALYSLPPTRDALVRAALLGLEARAYAHLGAGEATNAARVSQMCVEIWSEAAGEPAPDWMQYMNQAEVDCLAANAYIEVTFIGSLAILTVRTNRRACRLLAMRLRMRPACSRSPGSARIRAASARVRGRYRQRRTRPSRMVMASTTCPSG